jgi:YVTN family beta-propeller protein
MKTRNQTRQLIVHLVSAYAVVGVIGCAEMQEQASIPSRIYVANESSNTVSVLDAGNYKLVSEVDTLGHSPHDLSLSRDGERLYVSNLASGGVSVINARSLETIARLYTGKRCHVVTLSNDGNQLWVANITDGIVSIVETKGYRILGTIPIPQAMGIAFSQDGRFVYISSMNKTVSVVEVASHQIIQTIPVGSNPHFLVVGPGGYIWGTNTGQNDVFVIDPSENKIIGTLEVGPAPQQITFAYKGTVGPLAYVSVGGLNKVVVITSDPKSLKIREQIDVGEEPNGIWANPVGTRVYVAHSKSNDLRVIDSGTSQVIATTPLGRKPIRVVASK